MTVLNVILSILCLISFIYASDIPEFDDAVNSDTIVAIKFHSTKCGSCKEFSPIWDEYSEMMTGMIHTAIVNIDEKAGLRLAQELGVLDEGIPNVRVLVNKSKKGKSLYKGASGTITAQAMAMRTHRMLTSFERDDRGFFTKMR